MSLPPSRPERPTTALVVFGIGKDGLLVLPEIGSEPFDSIPDYQAFVKDRFGVDTVLLHAGRLGDGGPATPVVLEAVMGTAVEVEEAALRYLPPNTRPWQRPGWFRAACAWLGAAVAANGEALTGSVRQRSTYDRACVLYADTSAGRVYLKAGEVGGHEAVITARLAADHPRLVPEVVAWHGSRNWLVIRDGGQYLSRSGELDEWRGALAQLATFHRHGDRELLSAVGCPVYRFAELAKQAETFLANRPVLERWGLSGEQCKALAALVPGVRHAHARVSALGVREGPAHGDAHPMNALIANHTSVWFDLGEASIAHPFLDVGWCLGWLAHPARSNLPLRKKQPQAAQMLWEDYLGNFGVAGAEPLLQDAVMLALVHRAAAYDAKFADWRGTVPGWRPQYVPYYLKQLIKVVTDPGTVH